VTGVARPPLLAMRDYKGHSSRPSAPPPPPRPIPPRDEEEESSAPAPRRRWPWLLILLVLLLSGASWWWLAQLPLDRGQLGLLKAPQKPVAATTSDRVQGPVAVAAVSAAAPVQSPLASGAVPASAAAAVSATASTSSAVDFNFYRILPQMKVEIPKDILGSGPGIPDTAATRSAVALKPVIIQVGAFSNHGAARVLQERLALLGVTMHLHESQGEDGHALYSLVSDPFPSLVQAQPALTRIRGLGLTPVLSAVPGQPTQNGSTPLPAPNAQ
jgi:hypothetical protein